MLDKVTEKDLSLLEKAAEQLIDYMKKDKRKGGDLFAVDYDKAAEYLLEIKRDMTYESVNKDFYMTFFKGGKPFFISPKTRVEFYFTAKKTLFTRRNYKAERSLFRVPRVLELS